MRKKVLQCGNLRELDILTFYSEERERGTSGKVVQLLEKGKTSAKIFHLFASYCKGSILKETHASFAVVLFGSSCPLSVVVITTMSPCLIVFLLSVYQVERVFASQDEGEFCTATAIPFIYSFSGNSAALAPISTFMCI